MTLGGSGRRVNVGSGGFRHIIDQNGVHRVKVTVIVNAAPITTRISGFSEDAFQMKLLSEKTKCMPSFLRSPVVGVSSGFYTLRAVL